MSFSQANNVCLLIARNLRPHLCIILRHSSLNNLSIKAIMSVKSELYKKAIEQLNSLQSNAQVINQIQGAKRKLIVEANVYETIGFLKYLNVNPTDLDQLNCLHITGTKGKGSTAAFAESIFRKMGLKTGFYSSPHLIHVRERIRINGKPILEEDFANSLFKTMDLIKKNKPIEKEMPAYFKFLTLMAFRFFLDAKVDVAIIEVGIGGENDCTNVLKKPIVCGCATLDFDHCRILGHSLEEIAWQKAGIMKSGSLFIAIKPKSAQIQKCDLKFIPEINEYSWPKSSLNFGIAGKHQHLNVSLALQLVRFWVLKTSNIPKYQKITQKYLENLKLLPNNLSFVVPMEFLTALEECFWPGRSHVLQKNSITYYLDGAHTVQSIKFCTEWFNEKLEKKKNFTKILIFHCIGDRDSKNLLKILYKCSFDLALFSNVCLKTQIDLTNDNTNNNQSFEAEYEKCVSNSRFWNEINSKNSKETCSSRSFPSIEKTMEFLSELERNNPLSKFKVLVTGSLHLVGGVLYFTNPNIEHI